MVTSLQLVVGGPHRFDVVIIDSLVRSSAAAEGALLRQCMLKHLRWGEMPIVLLTTKEDQEQVAADMKSLVSHTGAACGRVGESPLFWASCQTRQESRTHVPCKKHPLSRTVNFYRACVSEKHQRVPATEEVTETPGQETACHAVLPWKVNHSRLCT